MTEFIYITSFGGTILLSLIALYLLGRNRKSISENLPKHIKIYRWIFALMLALPLAGVCTFAVEDWEHVSQQYLIVVWIVLYLVWILIFYLFACRTITKWFVPFSKIPETPRPIFPKKLGLQIMVALLVVWALLRMFSH